MHSYWLIFSIGYLNLFVVWASDISSALFFRSLSLSVWLSPYFCDICLSMCWALSSASHIPHLYLLCPFLLDISLSTLNWYTVEGGSMAHALLSFHFLSFLVKHFAFYLFVHGIQTHMMTKSASNFCKLVARSFLLHFYIYMRLY